MNRTKLKNYAPQARRDFIQAMTDRAAFYGLTAKKIEPVVERGDVAVISGREHPRAVAKKRKQLEDRINRHCPDWSKGFGQTMEAMAYTWFNRLVAIRFMELHGYLEHGYRVLSHPEGKPTPEILELAEQVELPGLKKEKVIDLKIAGNKEAELYRLLLIAQCNALNTAMPFLFEKIDDETELLLPDNLLHSDSLIRKLVSEIDEEDWQEVEIIGWLYQFYISEKKDEVIGKVVASEDIPAATQLFTPNWIVKYLVQNTLGRQWLTTYPQSALRQQMEYYIERAEQAPEVQEQLKAITPTSLNPEELTLLDPACGSGHILVEAYDVFKAIYQERGYRAKDIPALILQKNLFGLEIDDRAAQLAAFALMMKARADERRIFDSEAKPNILAFEESQGMNASDITQALNSPINKEEMPSEYLFEQIEEEKAGLFSKKAVAEKGHVSQADIASLLALFENAKTFGSLIQVPPKLAAKLLEIEQRLNDVLKHGDLTHAPAHVIKPLIQQASVLAYQHSAIVANPPYMGSKFMNPKLKAFVKSLSASARTDTFAVFMDRCVDLAASNGHIGLVTPFVWMFISSYQPLRERLASTTSIQSLIQLEYNAFEPACVPVCAFVLGKFVQSRMRGSYIKLSQFRGAENQSPRTLEAIHNPKCGWYFTAKTSDFTKIPGTLIAYWFPDEIYKAFEDGIPLSEIASPRQGLATTDNNRFVRQWWEVNVERIGFGLTSKQDALQSRRRWFPYNKGGDFRRWFGNSGPVVNWENDGEAIKAEIIRKYPYLNGNPDFVAKNQDCYFKESASWSKISNIEFVLRYYPPGFVFDVAGCSLFSSDTCNLLFILGLLNSKLSGPFITQVAPTMNFEVGQVAAVPIIKSWRQQIDSVAAIVSQCIEISRDDWNKSETSWDYTRSGLCQGSAGVLESMDEWEVECKARLERLTQLEGENNRLFIAAYDLKELSPEVEDDQIALYRPDRLEDIKRLLSYAIGCSMGRYSLDKSGLIYARSGNQGFDPGQYKTFPADGDGIIPLLETDWGIRDDAANRIGEFIGLAWPKEHLEENLKFIADSLGPTNNEQPRERIRRYLATGFYKHHLQMYKKRPIYWLFCSGKQRAFQCLVYLHRYHEGTLARMRTEYVIPLMGQIAARIEQLEGDKTKATSTSHRKKLQKEQDDFKKQQAELNMFEENLKQAADQKISLDLDDGVKVNYRKFGDLLAEAKAITGGKDEE